MLSNSWGGGGFSQSLLDEINPANTSDMLFVAAAGNNGANNDVTPLYPASFVVPNVIAVAATDSTDLRASFSNYGATSVHLAARRQHPVDDAREQLQTRAAPRWRHRTSPAPRRSCSHAAR